MSTHGAEHGRSPVGFIQHELRELVRAQGREQVMRMFFGAGRTTNPTLQQGAGKGHA